MNPFMYEASEREAVCWACVCAWITISTTRRGIEKRASPAKSLTTDTTRRQRSYLQEDSILYRKRESASLNGPCIQHSTPVPQQTGHGCSQKSNQAALESREARVHALCRSDPELSPIVVCTSSAWRSAMDCS
jgi:hypothetical protein